MVLREFFKGGCYYTEAANRPDNNGYCRVFETANGLWNAFFLTDLPQSLDADELSELSRLCDKLTEFLLSSKCMKWIEIAIIINYACGYADLYQNALRALDAGYDGMSSPVLAFHKFSIARVEFFTDYTYVISLTGPTEIWDERTQPKPDGF